MNKDIAQAALDIAMRNGANAARITVNEGYDSSFSILEGELDTLQQSIGAAIFIQLFADGRYGSFSTNKMDKKELDAFIKEAVASTKLLAKDDCRHLPDKALYYKGKEYDLGQNDDTYDSIGPQAKKDFIFSICGETPRNDNRIISICNQYEDTTDETYIIDSNGFEGSSRQTIFSVSTECTVKGEGEGDARPQNYWYDSSMFFNTLRKGCGKKALERTLMMLGAKKIDSGKYNIIIENTVSSKVVAPIFTALSGASIQQKNSFLIDSKGKKLFPRTLTISDYPHKPSEMGSRFFDSEGLATKDMDIIREGIVGEYFLSTYFASKLKCSPTIESPSLPIILPHGERNSADMMRSIDKGIYITGFNGGNCNGATGDFSFGIEGFFFEKGVISYPIKEMNMTGNILSLWNNVIHIGNDSRDCSRWKIPTLAFEKIDISGI